MLDGNEFWFTLAGTCSKSFFTGGRGKWEVMEKSKGVDNTRSFTPLVCMYRASSYGRCVFPACILERTLEGPADSACSTEWLPSLCEAIPWLYLAREAWRLCINISASLPLGGNFEVCSHLSWGPQWAWAPGAKVVSAWPHVKFPNLWVSDSCRMVVWIKQDDTITTTTTSYCLAWCLNFNYPSFKEEETEVWKNKWQRHNLSSNPDALVLRGQLLVINQTVRVQGLARKLPLLLLLASAQHIVGAAFICGVKKKKRMSVKKEKKKKWAPVFEWSQNSGSKNICD